MIARKTTDGSLAYLLLRVCLGLNIAMHGIARLISGPSAFADNMVKQFASTPLPAWSVHLFSLCLPWAEVVIGVFLFVGLATRLALVAGILEMAVLTFGTTLRQDWEAAGLQLTYAFVYAALLATREHNTLFLDSYLQTRQMEGEL